LRDDRDRYLEQTITGVFEEQVKRTPQAVAVVYEETELTYYELNRRSNQLGHYLQDLGVRPGDRVGICVERSLEMVVGLLGILKAGAAYVPLDRNYPQERLDFMVQDAEIEILLVEEKLVEKMASSKARSVVLELERHKIAEESQENPVNRLTSDHPAYIIYTSGSTGRPKGVCLCHRNAVRLVMNTNYADMGPDQVFPQVASISFDAAIFEIWGALLNGARLIIFHPYTPSAGELGEWILRHGVTTLFLTAGLFHQMIEGDTGHYFRHVRQLLAGGDVLSLRLIQKFLKQYPDCRLINGYGPTENGTFSTCGELREMPADAASVIIGRPISNSTAYVLDDDMRRVSAGEEGEIYLGGHGLAHGYWNQPELTATKFVPNPFASRPGERLYRSGDLGRSLADGNLEFLRRIDQQVKLRGYRIELGEVEAALALHSAVVQAVVVAREDSPGDKRLVAYIVLCPEERIQVTEIRDYLSRKLPEYMVPSAFVFLENLPLTSNGKIDRRALPIPRGDRPALEQAYDAPATATERLLSDLWAEVLHIDKVGAHDNFFELGGDSLLAARVISRLQKASQVVLPLRTFFEKPIVANLARCIEAARREGSENQVPPVGAIPRGEEISLGLSQERVWFLQQLDPTSIAYHFQATLQISGPLKVGALERSLAELVLRHEILRTTFMEKDGRPVQVIHDPFPVSLPVIQLEPVERGLLNQGIEPLIQAEITKPIAVGRLPLIRWILFSISEREHMLLHIEHHLIHDGWSFNVFLGELLELYKAFASGRPSPLAPPCLQFSDFAAWQQHYLRSHEIQAQLSYWNQKLSGSPLVSELPTDHPRPRIQTFHGGLLRIPLSPDLCRSVRSFGLHEESSLFVVMMSAFFALAYSYTRQADFCIGSSMANRSRPETEGLLGMLVNNVVLRARMSAGGTFRDLVEQVRVLTFEAYENQDVPFQQVIQSLNVNRDLSANPLFQTTFNFHNSPVAIPDIPELKLSLVEGVGNGGAKFDLGIIVIPATEQRLRLNPEWDKDTVVMLWEYNTDLFDEATIQRMATYYQRGLESMVKSPQQRLPEVCLLTETEKRQMLYEWNDTRRTVPGELCVQELFEHQVRLSPDQVAMVCEGGKLTYAELNRRANQLAHCLRELGVRAGDRVATMIERSLELVITELAILKCGAAYVPIDPAIPGERTVFMVADSDARIVLCSQSTELPETMKEKRVNVDDKVLARYATDDPKVSLNSEAVACIMSTSGSTGEPKGVMVPHRAIKRLVLDNGYARFEAGDRVGFASNPAFDAATMEVWAPLLHGGSIVVIDQQTLLDPARFRQALKRHRVNILWLTVGLFNQYAEALQYEFADLKYLIVGGDALDPRVIEQVLRRSSPQHLINGYGPTETTTFAVTHEITTVAENARSIPIGRPISNTRVYILDEFGQPVPIGIAGELYIGGAGLAHGYLKRPALTAERFLPDPFDQEPGMRMYKTGDLCRWMLSGTIEFLGRNDFQVKVRGFRIELGEIEVRLAECPGVAEVVVIAREDAGRDKRLVAYYRCSEASELGKDEVSAEMLRAHLTARLPEYMVPAAYVCMETLPLTASGKVDRKALPAPEEDPYVVRRYEAPQGEIESTLAAIWSEVLKVQRVGRHDSFFELGGHSLLATRMVSRVRSILGVELAIRNVFEDPSVARLSKIVEELILEDITQMPETEAAQIANLLTGKQ
jgi:amino acid adenylation domain-containing protein